MTATDIVNFLFITPFIIALWGIVAATAYVTYRYLRDTYNWKD